MKKINQYFLTSLIALILSVSCNTNNHEKEISLKEKEIELLKKEIDQSQKKRRISC
jgi:hypothetical protein